MTPKRYPIPNSPPERILQHIKQKKESALRLTPPLRELSLSLLKKRRLSTLPLLRSTIDVVGLNFSVRNGKRWIPNAITTLIPLCKILTGQPHYLK